jgi:hypothetical protein
MIFCLELCCVWGAAPATTEMPLLLLLLLGADPDFDVCDRRCNVNGIVTVL